MVLVEDDCCSWSELVADIPLRAVPMRLFELLSGLCLLTVVCLIIGSAIVQVCTRPVRLQEEYVDCVPSAQELHEWRWVNDVTYQLERIADAEEGANQ